MGLIPAHAGKTQAARHPRVSAAAHPRSRGENHRGGHSDVDVAGSSPLTRGKHARGVHPEGFAGLIPAHAGKTWYPARQACGRQAHPRSRGENPYTTTGAGEGRGSSPLTRGKHEGVRLKPHQQRLIPAHAGKTISSRLSSLNIVGSSPLTRGKRRGCRPSRATPGLIPAHAGKTARPGG